MSANREEKSAVQEHGLLSARRLRGWIVGCILIAGVALGSALLPALTSAAPDALPVRPTPVPTSTPTPVPTLPPTVLPPTPVPTRTYSAMDGGFIELQVSAAALDLWTARTVVEWQDPIGGWHIVEGWRGTCDRLVGGVGYKRWWVSAALMGKGPFRWTLYGRDSDALLAASAPFTMPVYNLQTVVVPLTVMSSPPLKRH